MPSTDDAPKKPKAVETPKPKPKAKVENKNPELKSDPTVKAARTSRPVATAKPEAAVAATATADPTRGKLARLKIANMRGTIIKVAAVVVGLVVVVVVVFGVLIYAYHSENPAVKAVASVVPYPVERVNGQFISYKDYMFQVDSEKLAQQSNAKINNQPAIDFNSADGKKLLTQIKQHSIQNLERAAVVQQLANQKGVTVTDKQLNDALDQLTKSNGGKDAVVKTIQTYYGWSWNDLKDVLRKQLLEKNLSDKISSDPAADAAAKAKAIALVQQIRAGADFTDVAKKNSQASDASTGGDLGFFTKGQIPDELQKAADAMSVGQVSDPIKDAYGYEIIKVVEKKDDGSIHGQHILIEPVDFESYIQGQISKAKINKYLKV